MAKQAIVCSTRWMADRDRHQWQSLPFACRQGHHDGPGQVTIRWAPCDCPAGEADPRCGYLVLHCRPSGCDGAGTAALLAADAQGGPASRAGDDRDTPRAAGMPCTAWTLLAEAHEHRKDLLRPSHPTAAEIAGLGSWIRDCLEAIDEARRLEALTGRGGEIARVEELAARVTAVVDAFQLYVSMLERFRYIHQLRTLPSPPLAVVADDERVLLSCRGVLRRTMQRLIAALQTDSASWAAITRSGKLALPRLMRLRPGHTDSKACPRA